MNAFLASGLFLLAACFVAQANIDGTWTLTQMKEEDGSQTTTVNGCLIVAGTASTQHQSATLVYKDLTLLGIKMTYSPKNFKAAQDSKDTLKFGSANTFEVTGKGGTARYSPDAITTCVGATCATTSGLSTSQTAHLTTLKDKKHRICKYNATATTLLVSCRSGSGGRRRRRSTLWSDCPQKAPPTSTSAKSGILDSGDDDCIGTPEVFTKTTAGNCKSKMSTIATSSANRVTAALTTLVGIAALVLLMQ
jgi:hypothetical protein